MVTLNISFQSDFCVSEVALDTFIGKQLQNRKKKQGPEVEAEDRERAKGSSTSNSKSDLHFHLFRADGCICGNGPCCKVVHERNSISIFEPKSKKATKPQHITRAGD